jgi:hypothetical protein
MTRTLITSEKRPSCSEPNWRATSVLIKRNTNDTLTLFIKSAVVFLKNILDEKMFINILAGLVDFKNHQNGLQHDL